MFEANSAMYRNLSSRLAALSRSATAAAAASASAPPSPLLLAPSAGPPIRGRNPLPARPDDSLPLLAVRCSRTARGDDGGDPIDERR